MGGFKTPLAERAESGKPYQGMQVTDSKVQQAEKKTAVAIDNKIKHRENEKVEILRHIIWWGPTLS